MRADPVIGSGVDGGDTALAFDVAHGIGDICE
jgi:hypothetical protein